MDRERDAAAQLIERFTAACQADDRILALLIFGSRASGTADEHSDIDFGIVTTEEARDDIIRNRDALVQHLGEPLFEEDFGEPWTPNLILADGIAAELIIKSPSELDLARPHRVLFDKAGVVAAVRARGPREPDAGASAEDVRQQIQWFWHDAEHVVTALGRGQLLWAHGSLEELRGVCLRLARIAVDAPREDDEPYWKVDIELGEPMKAALRETIVPAEPAAMREAAVALIGLYRSLAQPLAARYGVTYPQALDDLISARLEG